MERAKFIISTLSYTAVLLVPSLSQSAHVLYEWNYLNFTWPTEAAYSEALSKGTYVPKNVVMTGIKVWKDKVYLALPRWKQGVPASLAIVPVNTKGDKHSPLLQPYPNWEMQQLGNCSALQFVISMEIDTKGRMWVLENGRTEFRSKHPRTECPSRLIIFDLEKDGKVLLNYTFPDGVVQRNSVFFNDLVVDHENGGWAYITDADDKIPGIIAFSLKDNNSWKVNLNSTMQFQKDSTEFTVNGTTVEIRAPLDGIALSPASCKTNRIVYYSPLSSREMFTLPVRVLQNPSLKAKDFVKSIGRRSSMSDGFINTAKGYMYYGLVTEDSVFRWPLKAKVFTKKNQKLVFHDANVNQWPDTFAVDEVGRLWWTTNRLQKFEKDQVDIAEPNDRVIFTEIKDRSYMYYDDFSSPKFPDVTP